MPKPDFRNGLPKGFVLAKPIAQEGYDESDNQMGKFKKRRVATLLI